ncbi:MULTISPECIES: metal ABC transporter permease [unclassified Bacillus (in: firmicutes)]|uniref:metal ABC transporter permease n=1 Tax=unclassified Bacillus (in: firmicutes) TaxID=185979 RepID=UPI000BF05804|nr:MULTISPECIES: metal ABC transporter permease [unclassified Bacillus (in: firmicutes)]PEJ56926.1 metal ABC transporter permease [Bacillus sp. AFS002410]PEL11343.1 metal ABC transporter permease [Bacillus sp. AFS017336]
MMDFFHYDFLRNTLITGMIIGVMAPLLGVFVVFRRLSLISDALSHVTLSGVAASLLLEKYFFTSGFISPLFMGMTFSVAGAFLIEKLRSVYKHYQELAIPIILSGGMGLGVILISLANGFNTDLFSYLFGSVSAVSGQDLITVIIIAVFVVISIIVLYKELFLLSFDEEYAVASGINAKWIHYLFILLVALVVSISMRVVGVLLVSSLMTLPVASSIRISKGFKQTIFFSIMFGEFSVVAGILLSYNLNLAPGGTIVILQILILILTLGWKKLRTSQR